MQPGTRKGTVLPPRDVGLPLTSREVMNAEEAADFLRMPYDSFRRIAADVPRHRVTERRYVYLRNELLEWLMRR